ncbi:uncharacterized protein MICPUCDRAFT_12175, partial [Micromonas pusilla CCMP1545]
TTRARLHVGQTVEIILKADQATGATTRGTIREFLTNSATHPRGIKVRLRDGGIGRVARV